MKTLTLVFTGLIGVALSLSHSPVDAQNATHTLTYQKTELLPEDWLGGAIAVRGDSVYVSASYYDDETSEPNPNGAVYVFDANTGAQLDLVIPNPDPDPNPPPHFPPEASPSPHFNDRFGQSIAVRGSRLVVGAPRKDIGAQDAGVVYVFDADTGEQLHILDNPLLFSDPGRASQGEFGASVAFVGEDILVGAPGNDVMTYSWMTQSTEWVDNAGMAYLFRDQNSGLGQTPELVCSYDNPLAHGQAQQAQYGLFGSAVAAAGPNVLVGASENDYNGIVDSGAAFLFDTNSPYPNQLGVFYKPYADPGDRFGFSVAGLGSNVLVGVPGEDYSTALNAGAAYLFDATTGGMIQHFRNPSPDPSDTLGYAVAALGTDALVGSPIAGPENAGEAYLFDTTSGEVVLIYGNPDTGEQNWFGRTVAAVGRDALVGAPGHGPYSGGVYRFTNAVDLGENEGSRGDEVPVSLSVDNASALSAATFNIEYDPSLLKLETKEVSTTQLTSGFVLDVDVDQGKGKVAIGIASGLPLPPGSTGSLVKINFLVRNKKQLAPGDAVSLTIASATLVYDDEEVLTVHPTSLDGAIRLVDEPMAGDVNQNGTWDLEDVILILRVVIRDTGALTALQESIADANQNGKVEIRDALLVLKEQVVAKLVPRALYPAAGPVTIRIPDLVSDSGERVTVPIQLEGGSVHGFDLQIRFDPTSLRLVETDLSGIKGYTSSRSTADGLIRLVGVSLGGFELDDGSLANLAFRTLTGGDHQIRVTRSEVLSWNGDELPVRVLEGNESAGPQTLQLLQNYPNPFNPETVIRYVLPQTGEVRIAVYSATGQQVERLVHQRQEAGQYEVVWNAEDFASGVYLFVIQAGDVRETMKMVLLK